jgi:tRNA threonylcarbamoyl adenosine modification protein YeaZ
MILFIDTTENITTIALGKEGKLVNYYTWDAEMKQSEQLLIEIDKLLSKNNVKLADLKGVIVVKGPGGYTGLRVGISVANGLAFGLEIPTTGVRRVKSITGITGVKSAPRESGVGAGVKGIEDIINKGEKLLKKAKPGEFVVPIYPAPLKITWPKRKITKPQK